MPWIDAYDRVIAFLDEIHAAILDRDRRLNFRINASEFPCQLAHDFVAQHDRRADLQSSARDRMRITDFLNDFAKFAQQLFGTAEKLSSFLGQADRATVSLQQANAKIFFKLQHMARQACFRAPTGARGASEAAMLHHQIEIGQRQ